jgi:hypothetical protein
MCEGTKRPGKGPYWGGFAAHMRDTAPEGADVTSWMK